MMASYVKYDWEKKLFTIAEKFWKKRQHLLLQDKVQLPTAVMHFLCFLGGFFSIFQL